MRAPDLIALQEITAGTEPRWRTALAAGGYTHVRTSLETADPHRRPAGPRRHGTLAAARAPLRRYEVPWPLPWPEAALHVEADGLKLHVVHVPNARNGWIKPQTMAALAAGMKEERGPRLLCGDLNSPRRELPDGTLITFARDSRGRLRVERGELWDDAERALWECGLLDAYRAVHGYGEKDPSWVWSHGGGWRLDHVLVSPEIEVLDAFYHHAWRDEGLSDHSPMEVEIAWGHTSGGAAA